jgi:isocitrate dehydrogenase kinase/phosphatase
MNEKLILSSLLTIGTTILLFFGYNKPKEICYTCEVESIKKLTDSLSFVNRKMTYEIKDTLIVGKIALEELPKVKNINESLVTEIKEVKVDLLETEKDLKISENFVKIIRKKLLEKPTFVKETIIIKEKSKISKFFGFKNDTINKINDSTHNKN